MISAKNRDSAIFGWEKVADKLASLLDSNKNLALDGWYGIDYAKIAKAVAAKVKGAKVELVSATTHCKTREEIISYNAPYVTDDPGFGKVNGTGVIEDIMNPDAIAALKKTLASDAVVIVYGEGA